MFAIRVRTILVSMLRMLLPSMLVILGVCIEHAPIQGELSYALMPAFGAMLMIAFSVKTMAVMPPWVVFLLMIFAELYAGAVPGTFAIPGLVVRYILIEQREFFTFAPFFAVWLGAGFLLYLFSLLHWLAIVGFHSQFFDPTPLFIRASISFALYPLAAGLVFVVTSVLWPARSVDERLVNQQVQYLKMGMKLPKAVQGGPAGRTSGQNKHGRLDDSVFRRIRRRDNPKPWMEL